MMQRFPWQRVFSKKNSPRKLNNFANKNDFDNN